MPAVHPPRTIAYGPQPCQAAELYLPARTRPPVVVLLHGGFWRTPWDRTQMQPLALDLMQRGWAVWNLGYRRVGDHGGGWPGTFADVVAGIDALYSPSVSALDLQHVVLAGHSAGGHLALWAAATGNLQRVQPLAVAALAPVTDLVRCHDWVGDPDPIRVLLAGTPQTHAERYRQYSPQACLPLRLPQCLIHGSADQEVPLTWSQDYVEQAVRLGDEATLATMTGMDHMRCLDPTSPAHQYLCRWLARFAPQG